MNETLPGIWIKPGKFKKILTQNLTPGKQFFDEELVKEGGTEYRVLDPKRSKLGAAVAKGLHRSGFKKGSIVLYLGASHGYTPSYVSDIIGAEGFMICLDFAPRVVRDLVFVCSERENMAPLLGDAKKPESYADKIPEVDVVYQDIAQKDQLDIFIKNCDKFLKKNGHGLLAVKARSIDVTKRPGDIFKDIRKRFDAEKGYSITDYRELDPFEKDHSFFVVKKQ
ncbi:fibrillarin-like rRNA/tRNA 2'-O-methyltransferase [Candidatus Woesearchaeota archaeon]|nr:fibrillarin-like rRNA/tRNA 2'-O-methyltransferase [Candidatus Woesearchaeota archaeon]